VIGMSAKSDMIRRCFGAYRDKDREALENLLSDDFTFTSPYDDGINKATYFVRCWPNSEKILRHDLERIVEFGDEAFVLYTCLTTDGTEFRNTEHFTFERDRITAVNVYFGAMYQNGAFVSASHPETYSTSPPASRRAPPTPS
jgi:ketosteroid isomerase-like protein